MPEEVEHLESIQINEKYLDDYVNDARDACLINGIYLCFNIFELTVHLT